MNKIYPFQIQCLSLNHEGLNTGCLPYLHYSLTSKTSDPQKISRPVFSLWNFPLLKCIDSTRPSSSAYQCYEINAGAIRPGGRGPIALWVYSTAILDLTHIMLVCQFAKKNPLFYSKQYQNKVHVRRKMHSTNAAMITPTVKLRTRANRNFSLQVWVYAFEELQ